MAKVDWKEIVGVAAPTIATAFGGPLAGLAVKALASKLLGTPDAPEADVQKAVLGADPDTLLKLKEADIEFQKMLQDSNIKLEEISAGDRANARNREVQTADHWTPRLLAAVVVGGFLWCVYAVLSGYVAALKDPMMATLIGTLIGYTSSKADQIVSYYFGSSASSKAKDETISTIAKMD